MARVSPATGVPPVTGQMYGTFPTASEPSNSNPNTGPDPNPNPCPITIPIPIPNPNPNQASAPSLSTPLTSCAGLP
eukprot:scaffold119715_cov42-Phaeocystis_antarctica.AAC.1